MDAIEMKCSDLLKTIFNLNNNDIETYRYALLFGEVRADKLALKLGKDRTTVYRSLEKLVRSGLCDKKKMNLNGGGSYYLYKCKKPGHIKKHLEKCIEEWYHSMKQILNDLEDYLNKLNF